MASPNQIRQSVERLVNPTVPAVNRADVLSRHLTSALRHFQSFIEMCGRYGAITSDRSTWMDRRMLVQSMAHEAAKAGNEIYDAGQLFYSMQPDFQDLDFNDEEIRTYISNLQTLHTDIQSFCDSQLDMLTAEGGVNIRRNGPTA